MAMYFMFFLMFNGKSRFYIGGIHGSLSFLSISLWFNTLMVFLNVLYHYMIKLMLNDLVMELSVVL